MDSRQKRMSAMNLASPWRGPLVDATESGFTQGNRQAADLMYSGIVAQAITYVIYSLGNLFFTQTRTDTLEITQRRSDTLTFGAS